MIESIGSREPLAARSRRGTPANVDGRRALRAALALLLVGCTQSFDDLFAGVGGATSAASSSSAGSGAAGGPSGGAGGSGGQVCPPGGVGGGPPACDSCDGCTACEGERCSFACDACGCGCPSHTCEATAAISYCDARCGPETQCDIGCGSQERCTLVCDGCQASLSCLSTNYICDVTCTGAASCEVDCESDETCRLRCEPGAACLMRCGAGADDCDFQCQSPNVLEDCGGGLQACNRACP